MAKDWVRKLISVLLWELLRKAPSVARILKVWLFLRAPVQPLAVLEAAPRQRWRWHSGLGIGDVLVLDSLRCSHCSFAIPGELQVAKACKSVQKLRKALLGKAERNHGAFESLQAAARICMDFEASVLERAPYPVVGERYTINTKPSAFIRKLEN